MTDQSFSEGERFSSKSNPSEDEFDAESSEESPPEFGSLGGGAPEELDASFALTLVRTWIAEHQTKAMLGAFAAGVLVGSLFRE